MQKTKEMEDYIDEYLKKWKDLKPDSIDVVQKLGNFLTLLVILENLLEEESLDDFLDRTTPKIDNDMVDKAFYSMKYWEKQYLGFYHFSYRYQSMEDRELLIKKLLSFSIDKRRFFKTLPEDDNSSLLNIEYPEKKDKVKWLFLIIEFYYDRNVSEVYYFFEILRHPNFYSQSGWDFLLENREELLLLSEFIEECIIQAITYKESQNLIDRRMLEIWDIIRDLNIYSDIDSCRYNRRDVIDRIGYFLVCWEILKNSDLYKKLDPSYEEYDEEDSDDDRETEIDLILKEYISSEESYKAIRESYGASDEEEYRLSRIPTLIIEQTFFYMKGKYMSNKKLLDELDLEEIMQKHCLETFYSPDATDVDKLKTIIYIIYCYKKKLLRKSGNPITLETQYIDLEIANDILLRLVKAYYGEYLFIIY